MLIASLVVPSRLANRRRVLPASGWRQRLQVGGGRLPLPRGGPPLKVSEALAALQASDLPNPDGRQAMLGLGVPTAVIGEAFVAGPLGGLGALL